MTTAPPFHPLARLADVPPGELLGVVAPDGARICLANLGGEVVALRDACTHQEFPMSQGTLFPDGTIECAWHGARFDCRTGAVVREPAGDAIAPLPRHAVRVEAGMILVGEVLP